MPPVRGRFSRFAAALALALAAGMVAAPAAVAEPASKTQAAYGGYAFFYFTGEGTADGEQIYLATSRGNDPLKFDERNNGKPVLTSGLGDKGVRDPFIIRSPQGDKFHLLATDLKIYGNGDWDKAQRHGSRSIMIWESPDLVHWSQQRAAQVSPATAGNTWAPEAYWDAKRGEYVVFWASKLYADNDPGHTGSSYNRMMYATTKDFKTFSAAKVWVDPGYSVIDSTVIQDKGTYYRFTKDERDPGSANPCSKFIVEQKATDLLDLSYDFVSECIGKGDPGINKGEGPTVFKSNTENKWYLFIDEFGGRGYVPFETTDLASGKWTMSSGAQLPASPRHGTVLPITKAEHDRLSGGPVTPVKADKNGLVAQWPLDGRAGTTAVDKTGHGYNGTLSGDVSWSGGALTFGGTNGFVDLPDNMLAGADAATVAADVYIDPAQAVPYFLYGFGNTGPSGAGNGYLFGTGGSADNGLRAAISSGDWRFEQNASAPGGLSRAAWHNLAYTIGGGKAVLYVDGVAVARNDAVTLKPSDIGGGRTTANYLGRSQYTADKYFKGKMKDVRLYNRALTADQVAALPANATNIGSATLPELKVPAIIDPAAGTVVLPVEPGTDLRRLAPTFGLAPGTSTKPRNGSPVDLNKPVTYRVMSHGDSRTWTVSAREMRTPLVPGLNADPNIAVFDGTYYLYATTDGFPSWGSTTFSVWSSKDMVKWTDHGVALDLGPGVSWADKNAWAPTIAYRDGKYYFYFCAEAKIGVAVSDSPTGPFVDSGKPLVSRNPDDGQAIDPAVFTDDDGRPYLYWGNGSAYVVPLNKDMVSFDPAAVRRITGLTGFREGLFMVKRAGTYYLSWSVDDTGSENYRVAYATSTSPTGPFTNRGVILSKDLALGIKGTGHSSMLQVPGTDEWYIAYHRFAIPSGDGTHRETTVDKLTFKPDGSIAPVVPTLEGIKPRPLP
ncbi:family 43 glycosylhydrolase [Amycolatopsis sp. NPDC059657]|uniref:family 43 glycosylhydrolase n=1 Tax=Amycolatopsis sp. NPDC059657 TaxID=3346899 RepID=UPI0036703D72